MDKAELTMIENLFKNTGKTLDQWVEIVRKENFEKHGQIIKFLKEQHSFTHGFANLVAHKSKGSDAGSIENKDDLIEMQYKGKEHFRQLYNHLISEILKFGNDIEIAPKNAYMSLRRKKQFAILQPATKTRFEIGLNLKGSEPGGVLEEINSANAMCSHKINLNSDNELSAEVIDRIRKAYQHAA
jgi:predicted transport protein